MRDIAGIMGIAMEVITIVVFLLQFKGNVRTIEARPLWRESDVSPNNRGYHYNHNAETYMDIGEAMGRAMAELLGAKSVSFKKLKP